MTVRDIQQVLESWAPRQLAWERDNPGLQCGSPGREVRKILVTLDVSEAVVREAHRRGTDLIISHHPLLFRPLKSVSTDDRVGNLITLLLRYDIALCSVHTNLDFAEGGVSAVLARHLGLTDIEVLLPDRKIFRKVVVFVPDDSAEDVRNAMAGAGAGAIGRYDACSFASDGTGTFRPLSGADPHIGTIGSLEHVREQRLEMIVPEWKTESVIAAMHAAHPYEEVAYDVIPLENTSGKHGAGAIGNLDGPCTDTEFLERVRKVLRVPVLRHSRYPARRRISRVAVCGGGGSDLLQQAVRCGADALVTADISYHRFEEAEGLILLVDGGHYETEIPVVREIVRFLTRWTNKAGAGVQITAATTTTNTVRYHLS